MKRLPRLQRNSNGAAFTLIELMVVIAIIAVLAGLLLPSLARAKSKARQIQCAIRMKQWCVAFMQYPEQHEGLIPREGIRNDGKVDWNNWFAVSDATAADVWYNALSNDVGVASAASYFSDRDAFYQPPSLFQCPSARINPLSLVAIFSVAMNSQLIEPEDPLVLDSKTVPWTRIVHPSDTPLFLDNLVEGERPVSVWQDTSSLGQPAAMPTRFAGKRHRDGGNLGFGDGSVRWYRGDQITSPTTGQAPNPSPVIWREP